MELAEDEEDERSLQEDEQHAQDDDYRSNCTEEEVSKQRENSVASHEEIGVDSSFEDLEEKAAVQRFVSDTCKCQLGPAKTACSQQLSRKAIESTRNNCHQMTRQQLDLVIMSQVNALRTSKEDIPSMYKGNPDSFRPYTMFYIHGIKSCQTAFLFLHTIGKDRLKRLSNSVDMHVVAVGKTKFYTLWEATLPHIDIMKPASDLCFDCQQLMSAIAKSGHLPEDEKNRKIEESRSPSKTSEIRA